MGGLAVSFGVETIVIGVAFLGAVVWGVRGAVRSFRKTGSCSSCATSGDCPVMKDPKALEKLQKGEPVNSCSTELPE